MDRPRRGVPHRRLHGAGDVPHVLRRAPRRGAAGDEAHHEPDAELSAHDAPHDVQQEGELEQRRSTAVAVLDATTTTAVTATHDDHGHGAHHGPHESPKLILDPDLHPRRSVDRRPGSPTPSPFGEDWERFASTSSPARRPSPTERGRGGRGRQGLRVATAAGRRRGARRGGRRRGEEDAHATGCGYDRARGRHDVLLPGRSATPSSSGPRRRCRWSSWRPAWCRAGSSASRSTPGAAAGSSGSPSASARLALGYLFLANKYYLDDLYEKVIVRAIAHPIASAAYWVNQNVIDGVVNAAGRAGRLVGGVGLPQHRPARRRRGRRRLRHRRQRHRHAPCARAVRPGQPVRRPALRRRRRRRHRPRDRQRVSR